MTKNIKIILIVSLLLNTLMIGMFAGHWMQSHRYRPIAELNDIRPKQRNAIAAERTRLFVLMKEGAPNAEIEAQLEKLNDIQCKFNRDFMISMNEKLQKMSPEERARMIDKMMQQRGPRGKGQKMRH
ncbi:MAG: hypothetical protein FWE50_00770 [Alphaproteobacteria bacterium]|nr:hypothetical protein [Alphaproteobacteria bacterium]